jgi:septum formation topological specificity factor MinE
VPYARPAPRATVAAAAAARLSGATTPAPTPSSSGSDAAAPDAPSPRRAAARTLRAGELLTTTSAVGTSINYRLRNPADGGGAGAAGPLLAFFDKLYLAWRVFFPERAPDLSPKDGAKQRLRMILVADRCGLSPSGLAEMKKNILRALEEFVDIESEEEIDVSISLEPDLGTIYCVAVPVRRVKPEARAGLEGAFGGGLASVDWDPDDKESDPSSRFPMGC